MELYGDHQYNSAVVPGTCDMCLFEPLTFLFEREEWAVRLLHTFFFMHSERKSLGEERREKAVAAFSLEPDVAHMWPQRQQTVY